MTRKKHSSLSGCLTDADRRRFLHRLAALGASGLSVARADDRERTTTHLSPSASSDTNPRAMTYSDRIEYLQRRGSLVRTFALQDPGPKDANLRGREGSFVGIYEGFRQNPVIDEQVKPGGMTGSLRLTIPSQSPDYASGQWFGHYSDNYSNYFGENSKHFVQFRFRIDEQLRTTMFEPKESFGGFKICILESGNQPRLRPAGSSTNLKQVLHSFFNLRTPFMYAYGPGGGTLNYMEEIAPAGTFDLQNGLGGGKSCYYGAKTSGGNGDFGKNGCFNLVSDSWMTFQIGVELGPRTLSSGFWAFTSSRIRLWAAHEGKPQRLLVDYHPGIKGYIPPSASPDANEKIGCLFFSLFMTIKDRRQAHPPCHAWYSQAIVAKEFIPDVLDKTLQSR